MNAIGIVALFFVLSALINYSDGDMDDVLVASALAVFFGAISISVQKEENRSNKFLAWVIENMSSIKGGIARYEGKLITAMTEVVRFEACYSFILFTTKAPSRYFIKGNDNIFAIGFLYTLVTLLLGWWGIPWGPVYTLKALFTNIRGGHKQTVGEIINEIEIASALDKQRQEKSTH